MGVKIMRSLFIIFCLISTTSCGGGGTVGTGIIDTQKIKVRGDVKDSGGKPISNALIQVDGESPTYLSDDQGIFELETAKKPTEIVLNITKDTVQSKIALDVNSIQNDQISVSIVLNNTGNFVIDASSTVGRCPGPPPESEAVCGKDGKNYASACLASTVGVDVAYSGKCDLFKDCSTDAVCNSLIECAVTNTVCGKDDKTYSSAEAAHSNSVGVAYNRECISDSRLDLKHSCTLICTGPPPESHKICGMDGVTYLSECEAIKLGVQVDFTGSCTAANDCSPDPVCGTYTSCVADGQVCGTNGATYANEAAAKSAGVGIAYRRSCVAYSTVADCSFVCTGPPPTEAVVCGTDGQSHASECTALVFDRVQVSHSGPC